MTQEPHPDLLVDYHATRQITRGGNQAADDQAMEAMWQAIENGKSNDEAGEIMIKTYQKVVSNGKNVNDRATMSGIGNQDC
jgi:hypothetical protein